LRDEESMMERAGLDARHCEHHRAQHRHFVENALALGEIGDVVPHERAGALAEYLVHWVAHHILHVDQSMARQVRAIRGGRSAAQAFEEDLRYVQSHVAPLLEAMGGLFRTVADRNRELRALNRNLERRVHQRTLELERANRELQELSTLDELTILPNRRFAFLSLRQLWSESRRYGDALSVLLFDADHFKQVNDCFGHAQGDVVLQALAIRLRGAVRNSDIVCRLGGDEFLVICPRTSRRGAIDLAGTILADSQPFRAEDGSPCWDGSLSVGIAQADETMTGPEDLLRAADKALYAAKRAGGSRAVEFDAKTADASPNRRATDLASG
jgi:diguanylate cyclase (GGDEF)-like protein